MACQVCKSDCMAPSQSTGSSFSIHLPEDHLISMIVTCNVRLEFNELVGNIVPFPVHVSTYNIRVNKGRNWTRLHGEGWAQLIAKMNLSVSDILVFSMIGPQASSINVAYMNYGNNEDDASGKDIESDKDMGEEDDPLQSTYFSQRANLTEHEKHCLLQILSPRDSYVGVPFVHRLTNTNVSNNHVIKLPKTVAESARLPSSGNVGLRRGAAGRNIIAVPYNTDVDGHVILGKQAWREFHLYSDLEVGQAILVTLRNTSRRNLEMMIVVDSII